MKKLIFPILLAILLFSGCSENKTVPVSNVIKAEIPKQNKDNEEDNSGIPAEIIENTKPSEETAEKPKTETNEVSPKNEEQASAPEEQKARFEEFNKCGFSGLLYIPENRTENMPLVLYLHGGSFKGNDVSILTEKDGLPQYLANGQISPSAYILIPQLPQSAKTWEEKTDSLLSLVSEIKTEYKIDGSRISVTGHSMGGTGTWSLIISHSEIFSATAPLSGSVKFTPQNIAKLAEMPIFAVVGSADDIVPPESSEKFIDALSKRNPKAEIKVVDGAGHFDIPKAAYIDENIITWLISQTK